MAAIIQHQDQLLCELIFTTLDMTIWLLNSKVQAGIPWKKTDLTIILIWNMKWYKLLQCNCYTYILLQLCNVMYSFSSFI